MKKLILALAVISTSFAFAQTTKTTTTKTKASSDSKTTTSNSGIRYGIKAGMNVSSLSNNNAWEDQKSRVDFNAGVFATIPIATSFSIQPEILYSGLGAQQTYKESYGNTTNGYKSKDKFKTNLSYLAVPVMFQYNFVPNFYLEAGPEFGFFLGGKNKGDYEEYNYLGGVETKTTESYSDKIKSSDIHTFNLGIGIGAGYYFTNNIGITARYVAGLTNIEKNRPSGSDAIRNNVFQVGLAYKF